ncbi:MAG: DUF4321 domain-containing protein [Oscillospiraceae bacterium]|jgi:hypothetical protein|nr:DUF4321 domain-containing protein [Oscillospiraceae bacterium]MBQ8012029.1 DUF4321 domain-containing protein [Oscillospiraceae bacterium]MBQ9109756.1 DUF4321 domain-containing protein [Oscillospiraceae bacterium]
MKKSMLLLTMLFVAVFLGSLIAEMACDHANLTWLSRTYHFGISTFDLDLKIIVLTLGCQFQVNVAQILLAVAAVISYPRLSASFFAE